MSSSAQMSPALPTTRKAARREIDAAASLWLVRQRSGLDEAGEREFSAWLESDVAHAQAYSRMSDMAGVLQRARSQGARGAILSELSVRGRKRRVRRVAATATLATAMVMFAAVWWSGYTLEKPGQNSTSIAQNAEPIRRLPDGSIVELNGRAEIIVKFDATMRHIELVRGEALFHAERDPARPFVVRAAGVEVRAVGTAFNVRLHQTGVEVLVTEGKVEVDDVARRQSLLPANPAGEDRLLVAGEKVAIATTAAGSTSPAVELSHVSAADIKAQLAWRVPRLEFDGMVLAQAVAEMNRHNRMQLVLADDTLAHLRISGTFVADDPHTFARLVAATFGIESKQRSDTEIVLRRTK